MLKCLLALHSPTDEEALVDEAVARLAPAREKDAIARDTRDQGLARLAHARCCRHIGKAVKTALTQLHPELTLYLNRFGFGPVLLVAELGKAHAGLQVPEEQLKHFHPALHASGTLMNATRLLRCLWGSPEWLRYMMVSRVSGKKGQAWVLLSGHTRVQYHQEMVKAMAGPALYVQARSLIPAVVHRLWLWLMLYESIGFNYLSSIVFTTAKHFIWL